MKYVSTFGSGWQNVIKKVLEENNIKIISLFDGLVIFETNNIDFYPCFNNTYLLIDSIKTKSTDINKNIIDLTRNIKIDFKTINNNLKNLKHKTFKIRGISEGKPIKINYTDLKDLESMIKKNTSMSVSNKPDIEFIFIERSDRVLYFLLRLTYNRKTGKNLLPGELRPEVCFLLSKLSNINEKCIVLDPFCGTGAIPKTIIKHFKYNMLFATDNNDEKITKLKKEYKKNKKNFYIKRANALYLTPFESNFIDLIITDPPWNVYDKKNDDFKSFYTEMLKEFYRVLKVNGKLIVLMGNIIDFEDALKRVNLFKVEKKLNVLINGKKASVYLIIKSNQ